MNLGTEPISIPSSDRAPLPSPWRSDGPISTVLVGPVFLSWKQIGIMQKVSMG